MILFPLLGTPGSGHGAKTSQYFTIIRRRRRKYSAISTEPEVNNCFSTIFKEEYEKLEENLAKHEKQMSLSLAIMPRNPIITVRGGYKAELLYSPLKTILKRIITGTS